MTNAIPRGAKLFRDPIHDVIAYDRTTAFGRLIVELVDTQPVQRLRHVRQLGLAHYVYHGAEHSRFSHSMGAAWMAGQMFDAIHRGENPQERTRMATCAAALLHDIGHAPFSHTFESTMKTVLGVEADHEEFTQRIVLWEPGDVHRVLSDIDTELPRTVAEIIGHQSGLYTEPIVSSQLDADRMDYLLRDGYMTGVQNYRYDAGRILEMLDHDEHGVVVNRRAIQAVESYLMSRFHMYQQVYFHKTVRAAEKLVEGIFRRVFTLLRDGERSLLPPGPFGRMLAAALEGEEPAIEDYVAIDESHAWFAIWTWSQHGDPILADLSARFQRRRFPKTVEIPYDQLDTFRDQTLPELEDMVRDAGFDPAYYAFLDAAEDAPFQPYNPPDTRQRTLPFVEDGDDPDAQARVSAGQAIRIDMGSKIEPIEQVSGIAQSLTNIRYRVARYCVPAAVRDRVRTLVQQRYG